jgi:hypothetical protein
MCLALAGGAAQQFQSGTIVQGGMSNALLAHVRGPASRRTRSNNPSWVEDELILALDVYLSQRGHIPSPRDSEGC